VPIVSKSGDLNLLNAELNPICHLLALLGGATIVDVSRLRVNLLEPSGPVQGLLAFITYLNIKYASMPEL
jgi:hypothetical protein